MSKYLSVRNPHERMKDGYFVLKLSLMLFDVIVVSKSNNNITVVVVAFLYQVACSHIFFLSSEIIIQSAHEMRALNAKKRKDTYQTSCR